MATDREQRDMLDKWQKEHRDNVAIDKVMGRGSPAGSGYEPPVRPPSRGQMAMAGDSIGGKIKDVRDSAEDLRNRGGGGGTASQPSAFAPRGEDESLGDFLGRAYESGRYQVKDTYETIGNGLTSADLTEIQKNPELRNLVLKMGGAWLTHKDWDPDDLLVSKYKPSVLDGNRLSGSDKWEYTIQTVGKEYDSNVMNPSAYNQRWGEVDETPKNETNPQYQPPKADSGPGRTRLLNEAADDFLLKALTNQNHNPRVINPFQHQEREQSGHQWHQPNTNQALQRMMMMQLQNQPTYLNPRRRFRYGQ